MRSESHAYPYSVQDVQVLGLGGFQQALVSVPGFLGQLRAVHG